GNKQLINKLN
ncbi:hypothetical protein SSYM_2000, partial [Serratia symbiotica str. Tucson]